MPFVFCPPTSFRSPLDIIVSNTITNRIYIVQYAMQWSKDDDDYESPIADAPTALGIFLSPVASCSRSAALK
jgi:hypothetical protein